VVRLSAREVGLPQGLSNDRDEELSLAEKSDGMVDEGDDEA
jgi:hypothetical protein